MSISENNSQFKRFDYKNTAQVLLVSTLAFFFGPTLLALGIQGMVIDYGRLLFRFFVFFGSFGTFFWIFYIAGSIVYWRRHRGEVMASATTFSGAQNNPNVTASIYSDYEDNSEL